MTRSPTLPSDRVRQWTASAAVALTLAAAGCTEAVSDHPWLDLGDDPPHRIVEVGGNTHGQLVIVVDPGSSREEVLALGHRIEEQAPPGVTVNARIFNDEQTARSWRTAPAEWTLRHLLAVVTVAPETGRSEVRWMVPEFPEGETAPLPGPETGQPPAGPVPEGSAPGGPTPAGSTPGGSAFEGSTSAGPLPGTPGP